MWSRPIWYTKEYSLKRSDKMKCNDQEKTRTPSLFRRHECKYLISQDLAAEIRAYARPYLTPDPFAAASPDVSYDITSLYLDSPDLRLFHETEDGQLNRIKLRIRSYDEDPESPVFMEIKRRFNSLVLKGRTRISTDAMASILSGGAPDASSLPEIQQANYQEFLGWIARWLAQPTIWVRYRREAYVGIFNQDVRITMDRNLVCAPPTGGFGLTRPSAWLPVEDRRVVLEIKFDESYPDWVTQIIQRFGLARRSYSKYGFSVRRGILDQPQPKLAARRMSS